MCGTGNIAGSKCTDGIIKKGSNVRVMVRGDKIIFVDKVKTLHNFKAEVDKIETRDECGWYLKTSKMVILLRVTYLLDSILK